MKPTRAVNISFLTQKLYCFFVTNENFHCKKNDEKVYEQDNVLIKYSGCSYLTLRTCNQKNYKLVIKRKTKGKQTFIKRKA